MTVRTGVRARGWARTCAYVPIYDCVLLPVLGLPLSPFPFQSPCLCHSFSAHPPVLLSSCGLSLSSPSSTSFSQGHLSCSLSIFVRVPLSSSVCLWLLSASLLASGFLSVSESLEFRLSLPCSTSISGISPSFFPFPLVPPAGPDPAWPGCWEHRQGPVMGLPRARCPWGPRHLMPAFWVREHRLLS